MESSEAQGIVDARKAEINSGGTQTPPPNQEQIQSQPPAEVIHRSLLDKLLGRKKPTPSIKPQVTPSSNQLLMSSAINANGEAIHGIGDYISEEELSELEQGGKSEESTAKPSEGTSSSGSQPYRTPDGEYGLKVHSDKVPDPIGTNTVSNPEYDANTAPDNITPINESVASGGRLSTEPQEKQTT